ncbi:hypothetical protein CLV72_101783 [Allonocardiopsis opalescens]|uniref:PH (Pleckstrin Homology) domain-containing protein n=1 Tax=Allonocardiopsis opalescens TaxID=1144618 RepID=A0A2T0QE61_9ACTN|nr:hypothetical protein [Allonocardiopsis opalescens]PRY02182.1 hypothetical protein CLV72_101783 [Allonocardiopsis opalescens]
MPVPAEVRERLRAFLPEGARMRYVCPIALAGGSACLYLVVADSMITLVSTRLLRPSEPDAVWSVYPRRVRLGPVETGSTPMFRLGEYWYEIDDEYIAVISAADAELGTAALPDDPFPDG